MDRLRFDCYEVFAKTIEFPVLIFEAETGKVALMNYEAKLLLGQKTEQIRMSIDKIADSNRFWTLLHDRKAILEHHLLISNERREFPVMGIVNEFEMDNKVFYMLIFEQRSSFGMNSWLLERIIENSHVVIAHLSFEGQEEVKLNYISKNIKQYGYTCEEFYTGKLQFKDIIHPDDLDMVLGKFAERSMDMQNNDCMEYRIVTESRKVCRVRGSVRMNRNVDGTIENMEIVMMDMSEEEAGKGRLKYSQTDVERELLLNQKALEEKLNYIMERQVQKPELIFERVLDRGEVQEVLEAFSENNQLYTVAVNKKGEMVTTPVGPMSRLGEFYDMLERPDYHDAIKSAFDAAATQQESCVIELEQGNPEKQLGAIPLIISDEAVAACLVCALDEEAVSRMNRSIEPLQKIMGLMVSAEFNNQNLEIDSQKSRLAERTMEEELEGQLILAKAFANMRNDSKATIQEILEKTCQLLHLASIVVYCGEHTQESYSCVAKWVAPDAEYKDFPEESWRIADFCRKNKNLANGGRVIYGQDEEDDYIRYLATQSKSYGMMVFTFAVNEEVNGGIAFMSQERRAFREHEINYCQDVADIIKGFLVRSRNNGHMSEMNKDLLNAYNYMSDCVFIKDVQTGKVLFANEAMENLFGMDVTGMDSRAFLPEPTPTYTREGIQPIGDIEWQSYIRRVNKIMDIQELMMHWKNGEEAKIVIMRENRK